MTKGAKDKPSVVVKWYDHKISEKNVVEIQIQIL